MWKQNDGSGPSNVLQNEFTAYLVIAIRRRKRRYLINKQKVQSREAQLDTLEYIPELQYEPDMLEAMSVLARLDNIQLQRILERQKERNLYILFAKALDERSLVEIAAELGMEYQAVAGIYYRLIAKLQKELRGDGK